jgi:hypothetical protein
VVVVGATAPPSLDVPAELDAVVELVGGATDEVLVALVPGRAAPKYSAKATIAAAAVVATQRVARDTRRRPRSRCCGVSCGMSISWVDGTRVTVRPAA